MAYPTNLECFSLHSRVIFSVSLHPGPLFLGLLARSVSLLWFLAVSFVLFMYFKLWMEKGGAHSGRISRMCRTFGTFRVAFFFPLSSHQGCSYNSGRWGGSFRLFFHSLFFMGVGAFLF